MKISTHRKQIALGILNSHARLHYPAQEAELGVKDIDQLKTEKDSPIEIRNKTLLQTTKDLLNANNKIPAKQKRKNRHKQALRNHKHMQ